MHFEYNNTERIFDALLKRFPEPHCLEWQDDSGMRPLQSAIFFRNLAAVRCLLTAGANTNYAEQSPEWNGKLEMQPLDLMLAQTTLIAADFLHAGVDGAPDAADILGLDDPELAADVARQNQALHFVVGRDNYKSNIDVLTKICLSLREFGAKTADELAMEL